LDLFAEWFKGWLIPGSFSFFLLGTFAGIILLHLDERRARWGKRWLSALFISYLLMATPLVASSLEKLLQGNLGVKQSNIEATDVDAILVLGGGGASYSAGDQELSVMSESSALRLIAGLSLWQQLDTDWIVVSGGDNPRAGLLTAESETMQDSLIEFGVPDNRILVESGSANTHDQAINLAALFASNDIDRFILVTSPTHMRRAYLTFIEAGFDPIPAAALEHSQSKETIDASLLPNLDALDASRNVLRELFGLLYYALRGWI
jgi:uncharacterized SAM-binding protein YcdF (DUF218 family)